MASAQKEVILCNQCELQIKDKHMKCCDCDSHYHFTPCCSIQQSSYSGMTAQKKAMWKCHKCRERRLSTNSYHIVVSPADKNNQKQKRTNEGEDEVFDEINKRFKNNANFNTPTGTPNQNNTENLQQQCINVNQQVAESEVMQMMMKSMSQITTQLAAITTQLQQQQGTLLQINENITNLNDKVIELQNQNKEKEKRIDDMENKMHTLEQKIIRKNIEINNIQNEDINVNEIVQLVAGKASVNIEESDIDNVYRTKNKKKIVVEFCTMRKKKELMANIKGHRLEAADINKDDGDGKNNKYIYVNDQLTAHKNRLLWLAKKKARDVNWRFVWVKDGEIYAKKQENESMLKIISESDVEKMI